MSFRPTATSKPLHTAYNFQTIPYTQSEYPYDRRLAYTSANYQDIPHTSLEWGKLMPMYWSDIAPLTPYKTYVDLAGYGVTAASGTYAAYKAQEYLHGL